MQKLFAASVMQTHPTQWAVLAARLHYFYVMTSACYSLCIDAVHSFISSLFFCHNHYIKLNYHTYLSKYDCRFLIWTLRPFTAVRRQSVSMKKLKSKLDLEDHLESTCPRKNIGSFRWVLLQRNDDALCMQSIINGTESCYDQTWAHIAWYSFELVP